MVGRILRPEIQPWKDEMNHPPKNPRATAAFAVRGTLITGLLVATVASGAPALAAPADGPVEPSAPVTSSSSTTAPVPEPGEEAAARPADETTAPAAISAVETSSGGERAAAADSITLPQGEIVSGGDIVLSYARTSPAPSDQWVGIYPAGVKPGTAGATAWNWVSGQSGTVTFGSSGLAAGGWVAYFFTDGGYNALAQVEFRVVPDPNRMKTVTGTVSADDGATPLAGVTVTDGNGANLATTAADGSYTLTVDGSRRRDVIVYLTVPDGFRAPVNELNVPQFYRNLGVVDGTSATADFALEADPASLSGDFSFAQITDVHSTPGDNATRSIPEYQAVGALDSEPRFILNTGDISGDGQPDHWQAVREAFAASPLPIWPVVGNHDHGGSGAFGNYRANLGPEWYSFNTGGRHFIALENNGSQNSAEQREWLAADLAAHGTDPDGSKREIVIGVHEPWDTPYNAVGNGWLELLADYDVSLVMNGHMHVANASRTVLPGALHVNAPSAQYNEDGTPISFFEVKLAEGEEPELITRPFLRDERVELISPADGGMVRPGRNDLIVNASGTTATVESVTAVIDDRKPVSLSQEGAALWSADGGLKGLKVGSHRIRVEVKTLGGETWVEEAEFQVSPRAEKVEIGADVAQFRGDADHGSEMPGDLTAQLDARWATRIGDTVQLNQPTVVDGVLYTGIANISDPTGNGVTAVDPATGDVLWHFETAGQVVHTIPVVDGMAYALTKEGTLHALDASDGTELWSTVLPLSGGAGKGWAYGTPVVAGGLVVVIDSAGDSRLTAYDAASGERVWTRGVSSGWWSDSSLTVQGDTVYYIGANGASAFSLADGTPIYERASGGLHGSVPVIADGTLYRSQGDNALVAIDAATGSEQWIRRSSGPALEGGGGHNFSSPIVKDGVVYGAWVNGAVAAFDAASGAPRWEAHLDARITSSPVIVDDVLYVGDIQGRITGLSLADGSTVTSIEVGVPIMATPLVSGNSLFIADNAGTLYAFSSRDEAHPGKGPGNGE